MTWPAPNTLTPPPTDDAARGADRLPPPDPPPPPNDRRDRTREPSALRRLLASVPASAWVAVVGGALVLLAAAIVVVGNWDAIGRGARVGGLVLGTAGLLAVAERFRSIAPSTASIVAHVGTFLTTTVGIAAMSLVGFTWPACLAVGGALAVVATEIQRRRWGTGAFGAGQVVAIALAATGVGAITGTTGGLVAATAAGGLLALGAPRRAAALSLLAVCSPALAALADAGIGAGTFERAGLVGQQLSWSGPVVGVLAAMVIGIVALQRRNNGLMTTAAMSPVIGVVTGLAAIDGSAMAWLCIPGFVVIAAELTWWILPGDGLRREIGAAIDGIAATLTTAVALVAVPLADEYSLGPTATVSLAVPLVVALLGLALATMRWRSEDRQLVDLGLAGLAVGAIGVGWSLDVASIGVAAGAVAVTAAAGWLSRRLGPVAVYVPAFWTAAAIERVTIDGDVAVLAIAIALLASLVGFVVFVRARLAGANRWTGPIELIAVATAAAVTGGSLFDAASLATAPAAFAAIALVCGGFMLAERRFVTWGSTTVVVAAGPLTIGAGLGLGLGAMWIGWTVLAVATAAAWFVHRSAIASSVSAGAAVVAAAMALVDTPITAEQFVALAAVAVVVLTGLAFAHERRSPLDAAAGAAATTLLVVANLSLGGAWASFAWTLVGLQVAVIGWSRRSAIVGSIGTATSVCGLVSWWFTSGWHDAVAAWLEPADIRVGDIWMAFATVTAFVAGARARRTNGTASWLAFGPALTVAAIWLLPVQADRSTDWALPVALAIGLASVAIGGWRRLAGPLIGGVLLTTATVFVAIGSDVSAVPAWAWFAVGGLGLLGTAIVIERTTGDDVSLRSLIERWD